MDKSQLWSLIEQFAEASANLALANEVCYGERVLRAEEHAAAAKDALENFLADM